ncbi:MAG TPA: hypothetical protein VN408_21205 [Actinoplanes sp.]|nr:hypothetical protein [Actinoplanes sp.]
MTYPPPGYPNPGDPNQLPPTQPFGTPPPQQYGPPQPQYGQPQSPYSAPQPSYNAPQPPYGAPQPPQFGAPQSPYGAPQPQYGPPGYPPPPIAPRQSRTLPIVLVSIAIGLVLCVGGTVVFYLIGKNAEDTAARVTITEPATLGGLAKLDSDEFSAITESMGKELSQYPGAESSFGAFYGSPEDKNMVAALATKATIADPQKELDASFTTFSQSSPVTERTGAALGDLGGVAQCGNSSFSGIDVAVCGWADEGSVGMIMYFFKNNQEILDVFPAMRAEIESKS